MAEELNIQKEKLTGVMSAKQVAETISESIAKAQENTASIVKEALIEAAKIAKAPTAVEERKQKQEEVLAKRSRRERLEEAKASQQGKLDREAACKGRGHKIPAPGGGWRHGFRAALNSDGAFRPQCINCWKTFPPIKASESLKQTGASINEYLMSIDNLTEELLVESSKKTYPEWWEREAMKEKEREEVRKLFAPVDEVTA